MGRMSFPWQVVFTVVACIAGYVAILLVHVGLAVVLDWAEARCEAKEARAKLWRENAPPETINCRCTYLGYQPDSAPKDPKLPKGGSGLK